MDTKYKWQEPYLAAALETDWSQLPNRIKQARQAIRDRILELDGDHGGTPEEKDAIDHAIHGLNILAQDAESDTAEGIMTMVDGFPRARDKDGTKAAWGELYKSAVLETDDNELPARIREAKAAIDRRLEVLRADHGGTPEERSAIGQALGRLVMLRAKRDAGEPHSLDAHCRICQGPVALEEKQD